MSDAEIVTEAKKWVRKNRKELSRELIIQKSKPEPDGLQPLSFFMAGSPGAGKTEFSKNFQKIFIGDKFINQIPVRIDTDEVRERIPGYNGKNAHLLQYPASIGVGDLHGYALKNRYNFILDTTFHHLDVARSNVRKSLEKNRFVLIMYIYADPLVAWNYTKKREAVEGRVVPKEVFTDQLFKAKENIKIIKREFGNKVGLDLMIKNHITQESDWYVGATEADVDRLIEIGYSQETLLPLLT